MVTGGDAAIPNAPVVDAATAQAQEAVITEHTLGRLGPYGEMERDDPNRDTYLKGLVPRNALNLAVMGSAIADLVIGVGVALLVLSGAVAGLLAPVLFWMRAPTVTRAGARAVEAAIEQAPTAWRATRRAEAYG